MTLKEKINKDLIESMKAGEKIRTETIRLLRAQILEFEKKGLNREMNQDDELAILSNAVKKRKEAIELYEKSGRIDLSSKENEELLIIQQYLPKQLSDSEIEVIISKILTENNIAVQKDFGKAMGIALKELKGKCDNGKISAFIKTKLA